MKKPINKIAVAIWIVAGVLFLGDTYSFLRLREVMAHYTQPDASLLPSQLWSIVHSGLFTLAFLVGVGIIIELVDQIRWHAQNRK